MYMTASATGREKELGRNRKKQRKFGESGKE